MKSFMYYILLLSIAGYSADFPVEVSPGTRSFLSKQHMPGFKSHRSSLESSEEVKLSKCSEKIPDFIANSGKQIGLTESNAKDWKKNFDSEFLVEFQQPTEDFIEQMKIRCKPFGVDTFRYSNNDKEFYMDRSEMKFNNKGVLDIDTQTIDTSEIHSIADKIIRKIAIFQGQLEFSNMECGYLNGKLHIANVRYRRVFRNGIVLGNISYVCLKFDACGKLLTLCGKWPKFVSMEPVSETEDMESGTAGTEKWYRENFSTIRVENAPDNIPVSAKIEGMAFGWKCLESETQMIISPHYAFKTNVTLKDGQNLPHYFYYPRLKKYH